MATPKFQAFTMKAQGVVDAIVSDVQVLPGFDPAQPPNPIPPATAVKALWDTGASKSVLSTVLIQQMGLAAVGTGEVHHGDGKSTRNTYMVNFGISDSRITS
jgi:hypothetical protein